MPLVELFPGTEDCKDVRNAAFVLLKSSQSQSSHTLRTDLNPLYPSATIATVCNRSRGAQSPTAALAASGTTIVIAFQECEGDVARTHAIGPNWYHIPDAVLTGEEDQVHGFYLAEWDAIKSTLLLALEHCISTMRTKFNGNTPEKIIVTGYATGGGVSTLALTDIVNYITTTYGSNSPSPQDWAADSNIGSLIQHLTFASTGAADTGYLAKLNRFYERYGIRAWDFMNHSDHTQYLTPPLFRGQRGHRYILPLAVSHRFRDEFGVQGHGIKGYCQCAEWMVEHGTDYVKQVFSPTKTEVIQDDIWKKEVSFGEGGSCE